MPTTIVTINNIASIEYLILMDLLHDIYAKDLPTVDINNQPDLVELERLMIFFSNQYAYAIELWARMAHEVRLLKRMASPKDSIDMAMDKRDFIEKVMSACKLKYYTVRAQLKAYSEELR